MAGPGRRDYHAGRSVLVRANEVLPVVNNGMQQPGGDPIGLAVLGGILVIGTCAGAFYLVRGTGWATRYVSRTSWDAGDGVFEFIESGWMLFGRHRTRLPLGALRSLEMTVGSETSRGGLPVRLAIAFSRDGARGEVVQSLPVESIERRAEAMDLLFRIARITGHSRYQILRSDPRELRIVLLRDVDEDNDEDEIDEFTFDDDDVDDEDSYVESDNTDSETADPGDRGLDQDAKDLQSAPYSGPAGASRSPNSCGAAPARRGELRGRQFAARLYRAGH